jgi:hypothetical protein
MTLPLSFFNKQDSTFVLKLVFLGFFSVFTSMSEAAIILTGGLTHQHEVSGGQQITGVFDLRNNGRIATEIKLYQEDSAPNAGNRVHPRSNKAWIRLSADRLLLAPGASRKVSYTLRVPNGARQGTYWSLIHLEPVSKKSRESQAKQKPNDGKSFTVSVQKKIRYAVNIMTHIQGGRPNLTFSAPKIAKDKQGNKVFSMLVQNAGSRFSRPNISMEVFNSAGKPIKTLMADSRGLYPSAKRRYSVSLVSLAPGHYKALFVAEDNHSGKTFGADVKLEVKP